MGKCLAKEDIDAGRGEGAAELAVLGAGIGRAEIGAITVFERGDAAGDEVAFGHGGAGNVDGAAGELFPLFGDLAAFGAKGVGRVDGGACCGVIAVDGGDDTGGVKEGIGAPQRRGRRHAAGGELGADGAVEEGDHTRLLAVLA